jgi:hypothetical protein
LTLNRSRHNLNLIKMAKSSGAKKAPSTTGKPSGGGKGNKTPKPSPSKGGGAKGNVKK